MVKYIGIMETLNKNHLLIGSAVIVGLIVLYWIWGRKAANPAGPPALKSAHNRQPMIFYNFGSSMCPHAIHFTNNVLPQLQQVYRNRPDVTFKTIDVNTTDPTDQNLVFYFQVESTPTLVLAGKGFADRFDDGADRTVGNLTQFIEEKSVIPPVSN